MGSLFQVDGTTGDITQVGNITATGTITSTTGPLILQNQNFIEFDDTGSNSVSIAAPTAITASYDLFWPMAQGAASTVLTNDGSGNLTWGTSSSSPAGANTQIQFNNSGAFGASTNLTWDGTSLFIGVSQASINSSNGSISLDAGDITTDGTGNLLFNSNGNITGPTNITYNSQLANQSNTFNVDSGGNIVGVSLLLTGGSNLATVGSLIAQSGPIKITNTGFLQLEDSGSNLISISAPTTVMAPYTLKLPAAQGTALTFLQNDGSGNLSWPANLTFDGNAAQMTVTNNDTIAPGGNVNIHLQSEYSNILFSHQTAPFTFGIVSAGLSGGSSGESSIVMVLEANHGSWTFTGDGALVLNPLTSTQRDSLGTPANGTITIVDYTLLAGATVTIDATSIGGGSNTFTEGVQWHATVSNAVTAASLAEAITNVASPFTTACYGQTALPNQVLLLAIAAGTSGNSITLASSDGTNLPVSGATLTSGDFVPTSGTMIWNSTTNLPNWYNGTSWITFTSVPA